METLGLKTEDICNSFPWFSDKLQNAVLGASKMFWENKFVIKILSVTTNDSVKNDLMSKGEIYFTAELPISAHDHAFVRISSEFVRILFHECFGSNSPVFKLQELSELEIKILNSFAEFITSEIKEVIIPHEAISKENLRNKNVCNITFLIGKNKEKTGKIVVTLPQNCMDNKPLELLHNFKDEDFLGISTFVNIQAGSSKISLNDLKNLSQGDILLLENSNLDTMEIVSGSVRQSFKINPDPSLKLELDEDADEIGGNTMSDNKNIWDNIQIEVGAEFDKIRMTLGDLKQISKGLVIDLGPIFENEISLFVENKIVAKGELVIINDKYGVKVNEVYSDGGEDKGNNAPNPAPSKQAPPPPPAPPTPPTPPQRQAPPPPPQRPAAPQNQTPPDSMVNKMAQGSAEEVQNEESEEFDYSDFENEDK